MKAVLVSSGISPKMERSLRILGYEPIFLPPLTSLPEAIRSHPDTLVFKLGGTLICSADYCELAPYVFSDIREISPHINIKVTSAELGGAFPQDCAFNALPLGGHLLCRKSSISESVVELAAEYGLEIVNVKQGYPACSAISYGGRIITSDEGLVSAAKRIGATTYKIEPGHISLPPYEYGFIGGASGIADGKLLFFGDYRAHPSANIIEQAARELSLVPHSLSDEPLTDLGGMIFL